MNRQESQKWDKRYQSSRHNLKKPRAFLAESLDLLPDKGWALDVAMGEGHNANLLLQKGMNVLGVDFSKVALANAKKKYPQINTIMVDLPHIRLREASLDVILNFWFLDRGLFPFYKRFLKPGGYLVFETMRFDPNREQSHMQFEYLLQPGELLKSFSGWEKIVYDENVLATVKGQEQLAVRMIARKPEQIVKVR